MLVKILLLGGLNRQAEFHMILYNVTLNVELDIEQEWLQWMKEKHVPEVLATGYFFDCKTFKLLTEEPQGTTYAFQYYAENIGAVDSYLEGPAGKLRESVVQRYGTKVMAFRTVLEQV